ncbi:hypothetical protein Vretimale_483 [Volvox reticuliferus]|uniref:Uncharacterized protein n=1 Tax=Volvox reticuliferus TaxID=1737510 RepID=A0A8J4D7S6_9CHLO|nr:hypothetical protein Vretifemale_2509 [Volvox reticuliferus]GIL94269.1 hypothetical protein Vretimale_483 [Volvox reticuliferus]
MFSMCPDKEGHLCADDDARSSSLGSHEATTDAEEPEPILPDTQLDMRPPLPPKLQISSTDLLCRSSAPIIGSGTGNPLNETLPEHAIHANVHSHLATSVVPRRSEDTQASRLPKSLSTAYLLTASSSQVPDAAASNSDGGLPVGATVPAVPTTHAQNQVAPSVVSTPHGVNPPGLAASAAVTAAGTIVTTTAVGAVMPVGLTTPGSVGAQVPITHHGPGGGGGIGLCTASTGATPLPPYPPTRHAMIHSLGAGEEQLQTLAAYVSAETHPAEKTPTADVVWGQTERERVYNFLLYVPYQLERLILFGSLLLVDSFLGVFTLLPLRCVLALAQLARGTAAVLMPGWLQDPCDAASSSAATEAPSDTGTPVPGADRSNPSFSWASSSLAASFSEPPAATTSFRTTSSINGGVAATAVAAVADGKTRGDLHTPRLSGSQVYDMVCLAILFLATAALRAVRPGSIYYWLKDITSEFLKMSVLSTAFDMLDKILSNFGNDVLEALSGTCTQWLAGKKRLWQLASDALVAGIIVTLHALTLMCQALIVAVALNSSRNGLVALLIANNFVEIKSTVFKKWDSTRIWALVCADAVERFHLLVVLSFVVVEEMDSAASWSPPHDYLRVCGLMVAAEVVIDVIKHAVLGKFNEVRPGLYREFHQDLCAKALAAQSHSAPRLLNFHHLAPAALSMRIMVTLFWLRVETRAQVWPRLLIVGALYGALCGVKLLFGYCIKVLAHYHSRYYNRKYGTKAYGARPAPVSRIAGVSAIGHTVVPPTPAGGLACGPVVSAPMPQYVAPVPPSPLSFTGTAHNGLSTNTTIPHQPPSPAPAAAAAAAVAVAPPHASGLGPSDDTNSKPLGEPPEAAASGHGGSRGYAPLSLVGLTPRRLSGPAVGLGTATTGLVQGIAGGAGLAHTSSLLASLSGLGAGGVTGSGHAKVD